MRFKNFILEDLEDNLKKDGKVIGKTNKSSAPIYATKGSVWVKAPGDYTYRNMGSLDKFLKHLKSSPFTAKQFTIDKGVK